MGALHFLALLGAAPPLVLDEPPVPPAPLARQEPAPAAPLAQETVELAAHAAIDRGLEALAQIQADYGDGSFGKGSEQEWAPIGVAALGALAWMSAGSSPRRGPHGEEVERALDYLMRHADLAPESRHYGYIFNSGDRVSRTHGHGYATLALAEAYGMSRQDERLKRVLTAAVARIESSQGSEGGWYYEPEVSASHEGSVTICYVQALRAARNSGLQVDAQVIARAESYVKRLQGEDGLFRYQLDLDRTSIALTAAGISTLNSAGEYDSKAIAAGVDAIWRRLDERTASGALPDFPHYERLYLAQALWQLSEQTQFTRWFADERRRIVRDQEPQGLWSDDRYGDAYATAVNCLVLALPEGVLPIFQR